jgi:hypothetical protein
MRLLDERIEHAAICGRGAALRVVVTITRRRGIRSPSQ